MELKDQVDKINNQSKQIKQIREDITKLMNNLQAIKWEIIQIKLMKKLTKII